MRPIPNLCYMFSVYPDVRVVDYWNDVFIVHQDHVIQGNVAVNLHSYTESMPTANIHIIMMPPNI